MADVNVDGGQPPVLRVIDAHATPEEVAAIVAVFAALSSGGEVPPPPAPRSQWAAPSRQHRTPLAPGLGGWRASALPR